MKKTVFRFLSLMLCLVMVASLAACGKTGGEESRPEPGNTASEPVSYAYKSDFLSIDSDSKWGLSPVIYTDDGFYATGTVLVGRKEPPEGTTEELKRMIKKTETITIETLDLLPEVQEELKGLPHVYDVRYDGKHVVLDCSGGKHNLIRILDLLKAREVNFGRVYSELPTLNEVFLEITGKELRDKEE